MAAVSRSAPGLQYLPAPGTDVAGLNSWRRKLEVPELIHFIDAYETPFYTFTSKVQGKAPTPDYKFWTQEHRALPDIGFVLTAPGVDEVWDSGPSGGGSGEDTADNGSTGDSATFTVSLTSGGAADNSFFYENLVLKQVTGGTASGEWTAVVTNVGASGAITVKLISDHTDSAAKDPNIGDKLLFMSTAYPDGSGRGTVISKDNTRDYNYTQIMRMPIEVTKRMAASELHGNVDKLAMIKRDAIRHWKRLAERAFLFGSRYSDEAAGAYERTATEGFVTWLNRRSDEGNADIQIINHADATGLSTYTYDDFVSDMEQVFLFKTGNTKVMLCDRAVISQFNSTAFLANGVGQWKFDTSTNSYGIAKYVYTSPFGTLELIECPALADHTPGGLHTGVIVDPGSVRQRVLEDVHWEDTSVNGIAMTGQQELYADIGLEFNSPENCGLLTWETA